MGGFVTGEARERFRELLGQVDGAYAKMRALPLAEVSTEFRRSSTPTVGIASGGTGTHRGPAVTVIVRTTPAELNQAAQAVPNPDIPMPPPARTGGHTALPMPDVIRLGDDGIHYLAVFDNHSERPMYLGLI
jgi:hypothetical protein